MMNLLSYCGYHTYWQSANELLLLLTNDTISERTSMGLNFPRIMIINNLRQDAIFLEMAMVQIAF
jgi:hypothetical protein